MQRTRVLIVDDQPVFRLAARQLLEARGHVVVGEADGGAAALQALAQWGPDAVLLDVGLGSECGFEVARALIAAQAGIAVVLVSADGGGIASERVRECGARGFVAKQRLGDADFAAIWGESDSGARGGRREDRLPRL